MASNPRPQNPPAEARNAPSERLPRKEGAAIPALRPGRCDECGEETTGGLKYCGPECRIANATRLSGQGKSIIRCAKLWRYEKRKGSARGKEAFARLCARLDEILNDDRNRWKGKD